MYETSDDQHDVTFHVVPFHVIKKDTGTEISGLIHFFLDEDGLNIDSFNPKLNLQADSKGLSAALVYLLMAFYRTNCQKPITNVLLRAEKPIAEKFWIKLKGLNLVEIGQAELNSIYFDYRGKFPEQELKDIYELAQSSIKRIVIERPFSSL
jgi:hypothetical protein